jgi:diguanylate cyclase (GGDEF)-like protein
MNQREAQVRSAFRERFYRSVAETLVLLHATPDRDRRQTMTAVAGILVSTMDLPLVWVGRREPARMVLETLAAEGAAAGYAAALHLSADAADPGGSGPVGRVLREEKPRLTLAEAPEFAPWREAARRYGLGAIIVAASRTRDGGQLVLSAYADAGGPAFGEEMLDWAQRLVDELARFWDHQQLLERSLRINRYRSAQRAIQRALLEQPDPEAVYRTLANALVDIAGAAAVDVLMAVDDDPILHRMALVGPIRDVIERLPPPPRRDDGGASVVPTEAFMGGVPVIRRHPRSVGDGARSFHPLLQEHAGAVGCWPLFGGDDDGAGRRVPVGVFVVAATEADAFDDDLSQLLDEIAEATGLALRQHTQRDALQREKERQTYLALHDDLTGLSNRRALVEHLDAVLQRADRHGRQVAVGLLDLDDLKPINDRLGHAAGDALLIEMANRFRALLRSGDYVARLGGDEFVLVFENLDAAADLDGLLHRLDESLRQSLTLAGTTVSVGASLGVALYASGCGVTSEQLLRRADQAMYQIKARKRSRTRWWSLVAPDGSADVSAEPEVTPSYGKEAASLLSGCRELWAPRLPGIVADFHRQLLAHDGIVWLLELLPEADQKHFEAYLHQHLQVLMQPELDLAAHRARAIRAGTFYAACGLEEVWLLEAIEQLRDTLASALVVAGQTGRQALAVLLQRLGMERQWQLESMRELQRQRVAVLARVHALAWSADSYLALIQGVADILASHKEVLACAVGRPDAAGQFTYEAVAGEAFTRYLREMVGGRAAAIRINSDHPEGRGPSGRAWHTATIQRCGHFSTDPAMASWRELTPSLGVVSSVSIPLCPQPRKPVAVLGIFSAYAGGFHSEDQQAFLEQIKTVLDLALVRLAPPRPGAEMLPFFEREHWRAAIATSALEMHYQPLVRLADGRPAEIEALARLHVESGERLAPGRFLPALGADDLLTLFGHGLKQAMACRRDLLALGHVLDVSVNLPAEALGDARYAEAVIRAIDAGECAPQALLLEVLESSSGIEPQAGQVDAGVQALKARGVRLVEDDLGAGYSSLIRLRQWPFDRVKIDQAIVGQARSDPLGTLRFVRQLIRIGHDMGLEVVVEGLETPALVEAAAVLGADIGQGYALAHPMPLPVLREWLAAYRGGPAGCVPQTGLGALAGELRWEEQFLALPAEPGLWAQHARPGCLPGEYLAGPGVEAALPAAHDAMHRAAAAGPGDADYRQARDVFLDLLVAHVLGASSGKAG